ncbi:MAG: lectin like domain-containing protein [Methanomicrobiales archaeon]|nr:lectin like domain-containing protein [Methanomicrobiales archaeon]
MLQELFLNAGGRTACTRFGTVLLLLSCMCVSGIADGIVCKELAPLNSDFAWMTHGPVTSLYQSGVMPSPIYQNHQKLFPNEFELELYPVDLSPGDSERLPASFNLRQYGRVSSIIGDQGSCDAGWAFASLGSLFSSLLPGVFDPFSQLEPFSSNHLKNTNGFDLGPCGGGNADITTAYLARGSGPVSAYDDPYSLEDSSSPNGLDITAHLKRTLVIPMADDPGHPSIIDLMKRIIMNEGAVYGTYYVDDQFYKNSSQKNSSLITTYYNPHPVDQNATGTYQSVLIVGWDDSIKRTDFAVTPSSNGAFIVQNSYGNAWGMDGYFYLSYYDAGFNQMSPVSFTASDVDDYDNIYQHDPFGYTQSYGEAESYAFANIFRAQRDEVISAVGFYCTNPNAYYTLEIYASSDYLDLETATPVSVQTGYEGLGGYYTIPLVNPVSLQKYDYFAAVIRMETPGRWYPVAVEIPIDGYSSGATAVQGQSYVSKDGIIWEDFSVLHPNGNVCLKVFTTSSARVKNTASQNEMEGSYPSPHVPSENKKYKNVDKNHYFDYYDNQVLSDVVWQ